MADIVLVALLCAFIALCVGYISWCDRIIGPDDVGADSDRTGPGTAAGGTVTDARSEVHAGVHSDQVNA